MRDDNACNVTALTKQAGICSTSNGERVIQIGPTQRHNRRKSLANPGDKDDFVMINSPTRQAGAPLHVSDSPIIQCIRVARAIKLKTAEERLAALSVKGSSWKTWHSPLYGVELLDCHESIGTILKRVALLPIAMPLWLILALAVPIEYVAHLRELARTKADLQDEIRRLITSPLLPEVPPARTLRALWSRHGRKNDSSESALDLLCQWVDILYGSGRSAELKIRERILEIDRQITKANHLPYEKGAPIFYCGPRIQPIDILIDKLSEELPRLHVSKP